MFHEENTPSAAKNKGTQEKMRQKKRKQPRPPKKITERYLYNAGLAYLQRFTTSEANFRKVMKRKIDRSCTHHKEQDLNECIQLLDTITEKFIEYGYINDEAYTKGMVRSMRTRGLSAKAITYKLQQKGLNASTIKTAIAEHAGDDTGHEDFLAAIKLAKRKKIGPFCLSEKSIERQLGQLARAGYSYDISKKIIDMPLEEAQEHISNSPF